MSNDSNLPIDVIYTSDIPDCQVCRDRQRKHRNSPVRKASFRARTMSNDTWDMCTEHYLEIATTPGVRYADYRLAPTRIKHTIPLENVNLEGDQQWDYELRKDQVAIVAQTNGRFSELRTATTYAIASARWHRLPVMFGDFVVWHPNKGRDN